MAWVTISSVGHWLVMWTGIGLALGCGRIGYEPLLSSSPVDGSMGVLDATVLVDAGADANVPLGAFSTPMAITSIPAGSDDPSLTGDLLELYFNRSSDIWLSSRASVLDTWGAPAPVAELNSGAAETTPEVSFDGLTVWIGSTRAGGTGGVDIWVSTRASRLEAWSVPVPVAELNTASFDAAPVVSRNTLVMVQTSDRPGAMGIADLYQSTRASTSTSWTAPVPLPELNTPAVEGDATLGGQGLTIVFHSDRPGTAGTEDLYMASRATTSDLFSVPVRVDELNSNSSDSDAWLSDDLRTVVFTSNRSGSSLIYEAER